MRAGQYDAPGQTVETWIQGMDVSSLLTYACMERRMWPLFSLWSLLKSIVTQSRVVSPLIVIDIAMVEDQIGEYE